jgi:hypothetical protein
MILIIPQAKPRLTVNMTEEDPDDLVAAFFAAQAAKEEQKALLPTDDWINAISSSLKSRKHDGSTDGLVNDINVEVNDDGISSSINKWLVTDIPNVPPRQGGEIKLNTGDCTSCNLLLDNDQSAKSLDEDFDNSVREQIKDALVQRLLKEFDAK